MRKPWKYALFAVVLAIPVTAYAWSTYSAGESCPVTPDCPCAHGE